MVTAFPNAAAVQITSVDAANIIEPQALGKLKWRCRRGLLENDLFLSRFFDRYGDAITLQQARGLEVLMELPENDLLDLLLRRQEPAGDTDTVDVQYVLGQLRI